MPTKFAISLSIDGFKQSIEFDTDDSNLAAANLAGFIAAQLASLQTNFGINAAGSIIALLTGTAPPQTTGFSNLNISQSPEAQQDESQGLVISHVSLTAAISLNSTLLDQLAEFMGDALSQEDTFTIHYDALGDVDAGVQVPSVGYEYNFVTPDGTTVTETGVQRIRAGVIFAGGLHMGFSIHSGDFNTIIVTPWTYTDDGSPIAADIVNINVYTVSPGAFDNNMPSAADIKKLARKIIVSLAALCENFGSNVSMAVDTMTQFMGEMLQVELAVVEAAQVQNEVQTDDTVDGSLDPHVGIIEMPSEAGIDMTHPSAFAGPPPTDFPVVSDGAVPVPAELSENPFAGPVPAELSENPFAGNPSPGAPAVETVAGVPLDKIAEITTFVGGLLSQSQDPHDHAASPQDPAILTATGFPPTVVGAPDALAHPGPQLGGGAVNIVPSIDGGEVDTIVATDFDENDGASLAPTTDDEDDESE